MALVRAEKRLTTPNYQLPKTVLVVEDDFELLSYMTTKIRERGHKVFAAATAREAMQIAEQNHPTVILTDLQLPTLDELLQLLETHSLLKEIAIVIIDINQPDLRGREKLQVMRDFDHLDTFVRGREFA